MLLGPAAERVVLLDAATGELISLDAMEVLRANADGGSTALPFPWDKAARAAGVTKLLDALRAERHFAPSLAVHVARSGAADRNGDFESIQRSGTCYYRCVLSLFKYLLKRDGMGGVEGRRMRKPFTS